MPNALPSYSLQHHLYYSLLSFSIYDPSPIGESITVNAAFENYSSREITPYVTLHQNQTFYANGRSRLRDTKYTVLNG